MDNNMKELSELLLSSLNPAQAKSAEQTLRAAERTPGFPLLLLRTVATAEVNPGARLAGALFFKNLIRRNWTDEEGNYKLAIDDVRTIKAELLGVMIQVPPNLQVQIGEAISAIADSDFHKKWDTLVQELAVKLDVNNPSVTLGVLTVAHSIFKRWRPLFRSDDLFLEIIHVLEGFGNPYLGLLKATNDQIQANQNNSPRLKELYKILNLLIKLFFDLSCQELPPVFEENLKDIMSLFLDYLKKTHTSLDSDSNEDAGPEEYVKAGICEILVLYAQKYEDAFGELIPSFVDATWNLLTTIGPEPKYDILVSKALQFLTSVAKSQRHAQNFHNMDILNQVVEKIVVPNMLLRSTDEELFEDDPIEFIRRDLEGSDSDTRRRAATDFLRQLMEQFEGNVTEVTDRYIKQFLAMYEENPRSNWKSKDIALYLFTAIAVKGAITQYGVSSTNMLVDVVDFYNTHIVPELAKDFKQVNPIIKVDAVKYLYIFRSQFTKEQLASNLPYLAKHLGSPDYVTYTYSAITTERILYLQADNRPLFSKEEISPASGELLTQLFKLIAKGGSPEKIAENEFLMRCVMRILVVCKEDIAANAALVTENLVNITNEISKNPSNPRFNHYHFEALGALIKFVAPAHPDALEQALSPTFLNVLQNDVSEFTPYVFQLLGLLLESNLSAPLPELYKGLIGPILTPTLWETKGNIPALVRLLNAICARGGDYISSNNQIEPILGIFQKLNSLKTTEGSAFDLIEGIVTNFSAETIDSYMGQVFNLLLLRLSSAKTEYFLQRFVKFFYLLSSRLSQGEGPDWAISKMDSVQPGIFAEILKIFIIPTTQKLTKYVDRKTAVVGLTNLASASKLSQNGQYQDMWPKTVNALLKLLEVPPTLPQGSEGYDQSTEADLDDVAFSVSFATLNTARKALVDPFPEVVDARKWVGQQVKASPRFQASVGQLSDEERAVLNGYA